MSRRVPGQLTSEVLELYRCGELEIFITDTAVNIGIYGLVTDVKPITLSRQQVTQLVPILQRFVETGSIEEEVK
jgi:hypothetical protein